MTEKYLTTYEQPSNETMRLCLKLEYLLAQFHRYLSRATLHDSDIAVVALVKILDILGRPDLKSKLTQMMSQCLSVLTRLQESPEVDPGKLQKLFSSVQELLEQLHEAPGKIAERLVAHPFFSQICSHLHGAWGTSQFSTPVYLSWLQRNPEKRMADLESWAQELNLLEKVIKLVLKITRETATSKKIKAVGGLYQQALNPKVPCQMIRVILHAQELIYPEISVGRHRFVVRFLLLTMDHNSRPQKIENDVNFTLQCCSF